jgi:molybdopterin converting factor small subunit
MTENRSRRQLAVLAADESNQNIELFSGADIRLAPRDIPIQASLKDINRDTNQMNGMLTALAEETVRSRAEQEATLDQLYKIGIQNETTRDMFVRMGTQFNAVMSIVAKQSEQIDSLIRASEQQSRQIEQTEQRIGEKVGQVGEKVGEQVGRVGEQVGQVGEKVEKVGEDVNVGRLENLGYYEKLNTKLVDLTEIAITGFADMKSQLSSASRSVGQCLPIRAGSVMEFINSILFCIWELILFIWKVSIMAKDFYFNLRDKLFAFVDTFFGTVPSVGTAIASSVKILYFCYEMSLVCVFTNTIGIYFGYPEIPQRIMLQVINLVHLAVVQLINALVIGFWTLVNNEFTRTAASAVQASLLWTKIMWVINKIVAGYESAIAIYNKFAWYVGAPTFGGKGKSRKEKSRKGQKSRKSINKIHTVSKGGNADNPILSATIFNKPMNEMTTRRNADELINDITVLVNNTYGANINHLIYHVREIVLNKKPIADSEIYNKLKDIPLDVLMQRFRRVQPLITAAPKLFQLPMLPVEDSSSRVEVLPGGKNAHKKSTKKIKIKNRLSRK